MKINLKAKYLKGLDGEQLKAIDEKGNIIDEKDMARVVSSSMVMSPSASDDPIKVYELALKIDKGPVELDTSDFELVQKIIKENQRLSVLAKGQILLELKKAVK